MYVAIASPRKVVLFPLKASVITISHQGVWQISCNGITENINNDVDIDVLKTTIKKETLNAEVLEPYF